MTPWVRRLIGANVVVFFLQMMNGPAFTNALVFVPNLFLSRPWTLVTYMFAHGGLTHILFNMLSLYFFGPRVEERIGSNRFIVLYSISGLAGALLTAFLSLTFAPQSAILGASGAVLGVMLAFARYWPTVQILIMGIIPIEARLYLILFAIYTIWAGFSGSAGGVAHFAHLGGLVGAWGYLNWMERSSGAKSFRSKTVAKVDKDVLGNWRRVDPKAVHEVNRDEVNRILDKISSKGLGSLTPQERVFLSNFVPMDDRKPIS